MSRDIINLYRLLVIFDRDMRGQCWKCGYDRTGISGRPCPECGAHWSSPMMDANGRVTEPKKACGPSDSFTDYDWCD